MPNRKDFCIFFDIDGTLLDSLQTITTALNSAREQLSLGPLSTETVQQAVGYGTPELIRRTTPQQLCEQLEETYVPILYKEAPQPFPFIPGILSELHECYTLVAASNKPQEIAEVCLQRAQLSQYFKEIRGVSHTRRPKPAGDLIFIDSSGVMTTPRGILIGDSDVDVQTGILNNIPTILVSWGFRSVQQLIQAGAQTICTTPEELIQLIEEKQSEITTCFWNIAYKVFQC